MTYSEFSHDVTACLPNWGPDTTPLKTHYIWNGQSKYVFSNCVCMPPFQGVWGLKVKKEVDSMIKELQLDDKRDTPTRQLSGGMKRKLRYGVEKLSF